MALSDRLIKRRIDAPDDSPYRLRIDPFVPCSIKRKGEVSFGLTSFGYDIRLDRLFTIFAGNRALDRRPVVIDPATLADEIEESGAFDKVEADEIILEPGGFALGQSLETFRIPSDCLGIVMGKSTWARCGLNLNCTPLEPAWEGRITLELANISGMPLRLKAGQGVGQVVFMLGTGEPELTYATKTGASYQGQTRPTPPRVGN